VVVRNPRKVALFCFVYKPYKSFRIIVRKHNKFLKQGTTVTYFVPDSYEGHQKLQDYHLQQLSPLLFEKDSLLSNEELITKYTGLPHFNLPNSWSSIYKITAKPGEILIPSSSKTCLEKLDLLSLLKKGIRFIQCDKNVVAGIDPKGYLPEMECVINAVPLRR
jgi:hypothetical protein